MPGSATAQSSVEVWGGMQQEREGGRPGKGADEQDNKSSTMNKCLWRRKNNAKSDRW